MKSHSVVILESNVAVLSQLKDAIVESKEFSVVFAGDDGDEGIKQILALKPDLVIVGMFLKGTDGCGVIRTVKKNWQDAKIIATGITNDSLIERAMEEGASYYLIKPLSIPNAIDRMREMVKDKSGSAKTVDLKKRTPVTIEEKISDIFIDSKIKPSEREVWPVVLDSANKIVWLPGLKKSKLDKKNTEEYDIILRYY
jgi:tRNA(Ile)-lysidine synthetase-like protein